MEMMEAWFILGDIKHFFWEMLWGKQTQFLLPKKAKGYIIVHWRIGVFFSFEFQALLLVKKKKKRGGVDYFYLWHVAVKVKLVLGEEMNINTVIKLDWNTVSNLKAYGENTVFILWRLLL